FLTCHSFFFFFQAKDGIRDFHVTGVQTCALPISIVDLVRRERMAISMAGQKNDLLALLNATKGQRSGRQAVRCAYRLPPRHAQTRHPVEPATSQDTSHQSSPSSSRNPASSIMVTPNSWARASLVPASSPATT